MCNQDCPDWIFIKKSGCPDWIVSNKSGCPEVMMYIKDKSEFNGTGILNSAHICSSSDKANSSGVSISISVVLCIFHLFCIYFYYVRFKAKSKKCNDCLDFLFIIIGCVSMSANYIWRTIMSAPEPNVIFLHAVADCAFILSNASASHRLMLVSFNFAAGYDKSVQEKFRRVSFFVVCSCGIMALCFMGGYASLSLSKSFVCPWDFVSQDYRAWALLRMSAFCFCICINLLSFFVALRNFDMHTRATAGASLEASLVGIQGSGDFVFGRHRRLLVVSIALLTAIFWLLLIFIVLLPQHMASSQGDSGSFPKNCFWIQIASYVTLSSWAPSGWIRAVAFPICSMLATRSFESGSKNRKLADSFLNLRSKVEYKEDGTATYRLNNFTSNGRCVGPASSSRFSADDW
jgi:hypothetical protein